MVTSRALLNGCKGNLCLKQILGDLKLVWKKQKITLRPMGIIWQLFAFSFQPIWIYEKDRPWFLWSPTVDRFRICVFDLHWHWNQLGGWGGQRDIWDARGGYCMYHTALKWLVKLKIRTIEGFWSSFLLWHTFSSGLFSGHFFSADQTHSFVLFRKIPLHQSRIHWIFS